MVWRSLPSLIAFAPLDSRLPGVCAEMGALTSDAEGLLAILERINPRQQSQPATSSSPKVPAASVDDLLQAAHFLVRFVALEAV
jgi:hypothetical protein